MNISDNLKSAVRDRNIADIRGALWSCLMVDMNMTGKFAQSLEYVLSNGISESELYEDDDGSSFDEEATEENFDTLAGLIRVNFSKRKLGSLKSIGCVLSPPKQSIRRAPTVTRGGNGTTVREVPPPRGRDDAGRKPGTRATTIAVIAATVIIIAVGGGYLLYRIIK